MKPLVTSALWALAGWIGSAPPPGPLQEPAPAETEQEPAAPERSFQPGPGIVPPSASDEARALWTRLLQATRPLDGTPAVEAGVRAFDVRFDVLQRQASADDRSPGSVDGKTRVKWLEGDETHADYVELTIEEGDLKQTGYGPAGYYIAAKEGVIDIGRSRDYKTDRELVQRTVSLARNLAGLADFSRLTLYELFPLEDPPPGALPKGELQARPKKLDWLLLVTPDFRLSEELAGGRASSGLDVKDLYFVSVGLDRESSEPRLIHVRKKPRPDRSTPPEQLVELRVPQRIDGWWLPKHLYLWERQPLARDPKLQQFVDGRADREAHVLSGSRVNPGITATDFEPN